MFSYSPITKSGFQAIIDSTFSDEYKNQYDTIQEQINADKQSITTESVDNFSNFSWQSPNIDLQVGDSPALDEAIKLYYKYVQQAKIENWTSDNYDLQEKHMLPTANVFTNFDVFTIDERLNFQSAINVIYETYKKSPDLFYGALLVKKDSKFIINPLNHIVARIIQRSGKIPSGEFKIVFYFHKDIETPSYPETFKNDFHDLYKTQALLQLGILEEAPSTKLFYESVISNHPSYAQKANQITAIQVNFKYLNKQGEEVRSVPEYFIQPTQIVNTGIVYPYYGMTIVKNDQWRVQGFHTSPMMSSNVGFPTFKFTDENILQINPTSVCTGNRLSNQSLAGRRTLNHSNLLSPYIRNSLCHGSFDYARICVEISLNIYSEIYGLEPISEFSVPQSKKRISFNEYKEQFNSSSLQDYLAYIKTINEQEFIHA